MFFYLSFFNNTLTLHSVIFLSQTLETDCALGFEWIGCFKDDKKDPRPLPDYIMTDRERRLKIYSGQSIDWRNWDVYLPQFVCRCATLAKEKGHDTFSVQFYGVCREVPPFPGISNFKF